MKIHQLFCAAALSITMSVQAQWPASVILNTANNNMGGVVGIGAQDLVWRCSNVLGGPYTLIPEQVPVFSGWHNGTSAPSFPPNAQWISYPHTCVPGSPSEDYCGCPIEAPCVDDFYEATFTLNPGSYALNLTMMADNVIVAVYLNGSPVYNAPAVQLAPGSPYYNGYLFYGHQAPNQVNLSIPSGFLFFPAVNSLRVHVRSGINQANSGWTGFIAFHSGCYKCDSDDEGDPRDPKDPPTGRFQYNPSGPEIEFSDKNSVVLNQNVPNPFAESTVISYSIPQSFSKAQLVFRTSEGTLVKTMDIKQAGRGSVTVFADDLSKGTYSYSLMIDGKEADTKKMLKE